MINSNMAPQGMAVTPHHLASESALAILREGGNAIEAMVAAAATIAVVYPHMNGLGGDGFWLIVPPDGNPITIDASGPAGQLATLERYRDYQHIPHRGPPAALTVAGTVGGWEEALKVASELSHNALPLRRLLTDAIRYATNGAPVTPSQAIATRAKAHELAKFTDFANVFMPQGNIPHAGEHFVQPQLGQTLNALAEQGLGSFYRGPLAEKIMADITAIEMPITAQDLAEYHPKRRTPLRLQHQHGEIFNLAPPTQGLVSLAILGLADRHSVAQMNEGQTIHTLVEATKLAFGLRDQVITDPRWMAHCPQSLLEKEPLDQLAANLNSEQAADWGGGRGPGDTVWMGVIDRNGLAVSFIQSIYHEFGSGILLPATGIVWQNRGASFSLAPHHLLALAPGKQPFHTLNPAAARLRDGRTLVYGAMGGDGQPQTQAAVFIRHVVQGLPLQQAITAPRWLLGRTWGQSSDSLKLEARFALETLNDLRQRGHQIELLPDFSEIVGHAGAIVRHPNGMLEGAFDPRSNGSAAGY
ncbi:gamma-glutamyltransferase family protein [Yersinia hibernica]|uniref:Gamma-glutamyltransferase family protein n=1 Tax=Yersinia hibernica TaxID=2339259 RepID=A0ABX5R1Z6_9GAMM|nr:gamma-glutamyltransferase family protein [Yersinia hibernica]QAX79654.1 gamma-glutamyltransferase family protein [Yersinia hibernica]